MPVERKLTRIERAASKVLGTRFPQFSTAYRDQVAVEVVKGILSATFECMPFCAAPEPSGSTNLAMGAFGLVDDAAELIALSAAASAEITREHWRCMRAMQAGLPIVPPDLPIAAHLEDMLRGREVLPEVRRAS